MELNRIIEILDAHTTTRETHTWGVVQMFIGSSLTAAAEQILSEMQPKEELPPQLNKHDVIRSAFMVTVKANDITQSVVTYAKDKQEAKEKVLAAWFRYEVVRVQKCHSVD